MKRRADGTKARWKKSDRDLRDRGTRTDRAARPERGERRERGNDRPTSRPGRTEWRDDRRGEARATRRGDSFGERSERSGWTGPQEAPRQNRARADRPRVERTERPRAERSWSDRPRTERTDRQDRSRAERADRPWSDRPRSDRPRADRADRQDRRRAERTDRPGSDRPRADRADRQDRPRADRPRNDRPRDDRPRNDRPRNDRPRNDRPARERRPVSIPPLTGPNAFVDLGVPTEFAAVLAMSDITEPTPIQELTIPAALSGRDVLGRGRTGSGKTLSFGLPMLTRLDHPAGLRRQPRGLVLAPTRELAMQVADALRPVAAVRGLRLQLVIGGSSYERQIRGLMSADIVVATPGRLVDLANQEVVDLSAVQMFVLDEADHMADLGFMDEIDKILGQLPSDAQGLLFSATLDTDVDRLVRTYLHDPVEHNADPATASVGTMAHHVVLVHPKDKDAVTVDIARRRGRTVAFVRTQLGAERLAGQLEDEGVRVAALHGGMKQGARTRTLADFRAGLIDVLVATDVAARGIHVDDVDLVLHVDPPHGPKEYLHRSGRTARAGSSGTVVSLATLRQQRMVHAITAKAGVDPDVLRARPGDDALRDLVG